MSSSSSTWKGCGAGGAGCGGGARRTALAGRRCGCRDGADRRCRCPRMANSRTLLLAVFLSILVMVMLVTAVLLPLYRAPPSQSRATTTNNNSNNDRRRRPRLVWHVGPMKTGTTALQLALREWSSSMNGTGSTSSSINSTATLNNNNTNNNNTNNNNNNWVYLGPSSFMKGRRSSNRNNNNNNNNRNNNNGTAIPNVGAGITDEDFPERFARLLQSYQNDGDGDGDGVTNVVVSSEYFSIAYRSQHYRAVAQRLGNWDVQLVLGYRPYYEWIPSRYSQAHKATPQQRGSSKKGGTVDPYPWKDALARRWKHPVRPLFPTYYRETIQAERIFADDVYEYAAPHFPNITVLSLQPDLVPTFFCDILRVETACQQQRQPASSVPQQQQQQPPQQQKQNGIVNPSRLTSIRCDAIALGAAARGLIDIQRHTRTEIMEAVEREILSTPTTATTTTKKRLPLICPPRATLDRVWKQTVHREARLFYPPSSIGATATMTTATTSTPRLPERRIEQLRRGFQQYVDDQTFCHVNVTAVLEDPEWRQFLAPFGRTENRAAGP